MTDAIAAEAAIDMDAVNEFAFRIAGDIGAAMHATTRTEMSDVLVRAQTYRHLAGRDGALELARLAASRLENAELAALIENCGAVLAH